MKTARAGLAQLAEQGHDQRSAEVDRDELAVYHRERSSRLTKGLAGLGLAGAGIARVLSAPAFAASNADVQAAQTAASLENLAVMVYNQAAALPFMKTIANPAGATVTAFVTKTVQQHTDHAAAFNAAAVNLGGVKQTKPDQTVLDKVVTPALPGLQTPLDVVKFAADLELVAAATYSAETAAVTDKDLRKTFASIMGVENQHRSILLAVAALLAANLPQLVTLGPPTDQLPDAAGSAGFPDAFLKTDQARPATEGAVNS